MSTSSLIFWRLAVFFQPETTCRTTSPPFSTRLGTNLKPSRWMSAKTVLLQLEGAVVLAGLAALTQKRDDLLREAAGRGEGRRVRVDVGDVAVLRVEPGAVAVHGVLLADGGVLSAGHRACIWTQRNRLAGEHLEAPHALGAAASDGPVRGMTVWPGSRRELRRPGGCADGHRLVGPCRSAMRTDRGCEHCGCESPGRCAGASAPLCHPPAHGGQHPQVRAAGALCTSSWPPAR
jgi:hypothetical protein